MIKGIDVSHLNGKPGAQPIDWTIWQYAWNEQIAGISTNVDADLAKT